MSRTRRKLPYKAYRRARGRIASLRRGDRKGAIPPDPWDDKSHSRESLAPWNMAWSMGRHGHDAEEIAKQIHKTFDVPYVRAINIGRIIEQRRIRRERETDS